MTAQNVVKALIKGAAVVIIYAVLFSIGGMWVELPASAGTPLSPEEQAGNAIALVIVAVIDVTVLTGLVLTSRWRGWRLWLFITAVFYGVRTFTSQLESWYFMLNVTTDMLPGLFAMTLPASVIGTLLVVLFFGRWRGAMEAPVWRLPALSWQQWLSRWFFLSAIVYPVLFFGLRYFVAWQSPAVREFYGGALGNGALEHYARLFSQDPFVYPFEVLRGALWVLMAVAILWTSRGPAWRSGLWICLLFALVQNDVHLLANPLMPPEVRRYHFIETATSNLINAWLIVWLMHRPGDRSSVAQWERSASTMWADGLNVRKQGHDSEREMS